LLSRSGRYLVCTGHGALFKPDSGLCVKGPCVGEALASLAIRVQDRMVVLDD
jgi:nitrite reductase/ring-hydroxylating ferredoxin subunit